MKKIAFITTLFILFISCSKDEVLSDENTISSFQLNFNGTLTSGTINQSNGQITFDVKGADLSSLTPIITYSNKATISPSENTPKNFTNPVPYTVTAENGDTSVYTVTVNNTPLSTERKITSFQLTFNGNIKTGVINESAKTITFDVKGADLSSLTPIITYSNKATISPSENTPKNFTNPVPYTVTAENGDESVYIVTVNNTPLSSDSFITKFQLTINGNTVLGDIDETTKIISINVDPVDLKSLIPTIEISELATISYQTGNNQNFEDEVLYTVTAEDGSTSSYKVRVNWPKINKISGFFGPQTASNLLYFSGASFTIIGENLYTDFGYKLFLSNGTVDIELNIQSSSLRQADTNVYNYNIKIPENTTTSVYKLYYQRNNKIIEYSQNFDINENSPIISSTNQNVYNYNDIMIINGENLTKAIAIPSNGSQYLISTTNSTSTSYNYTLSADKKQIQLKLDNFQLFPSYYGNAPEVKYILLVGENRRIGPIINVTFN
jgi:hypothetical protein